MGSTSMTASPPGARRTSTSPESFRPACTIGPAAENTTPAPSTATPSTRSASFARRTRERPPATVRLAAPSRSGSATSHGPDTSTSAAPAATDPAAASRRGPRREATGGLLGRALGTSRGPQLVPDEGDDRRDDDDP